ncbi:helix-turn-helix domain-containing protein [Aurantiacibacter marinus]|uniref:helix-turn-helix domain-containing protein n=1 Tax=Aurantiacibacter marinus TaxID=874156 RepID=UPI0018CD6B20|nr:helix-turn-helix domain-containing protein [Aurantiacibacter marinus]
MLFHFATDVPRIEDLQPGALGQFVMFPRGTGTINFGERTEHLVSRLNLMSGFSTAAPFTMDGPWHAVGMSLSPLGWAALTGTPASEHVDQFCPAAELLGDDAALFGKDLSARYRNGEISGRDASFAMADWIMPRLAKVPPAHEKLIERTIIWLSGSMNPDLSLLFDTLNYSRRQAERLVEQYFGFPPAALARKYRAVRAAALLSKERLTGHEEAAVADAFYDQPHMVREIRRYCGYTPSRLGGDGQPILKTLLQMKNFNRLLEFRAS